MLLLHASLCGCLGRPACPAPQALHVAVMAGQRQCVELLLQAGAPAGLRNSRSWAPVYLALEVGALSLSLTG